MNLRSTRLVNIAVALIAAAVLAGCAPTSVADDIGRGAAKGADDVTVPSGSGPDDLSRLGGGADDASRAEGESAQASGELRTMIEGDGRTWVCLGLDVVKASGDGDLTFEEYATILIEHGFSHVPAYRAQTAFNASVQLLDGDLSQLQELACV